jgi:hypothetical protein
MDDAEIKFSRALLLADKLTNEIEIFLSADPATITSKRFENGRVEVYLNVKKDIPVQFSLMLGEILHNARSALDAAMYSFVTNRAVNLGLTIKEHEIFFKIEDEPRKYSSDKKWHQNTLTLREKRWLADYQPFGFARAVPEKERDEVRKRAPLARLRDLSNADKHRQLKVILVELNMLAIQTEEGDKLSNSMFARPPWRDGELLYSYVHSAKNPSNPRISADFKVALEEDAVPLNVHALTDVLRGIFQHVRLTIDEIKRIERASPSL